MKKALLMAGGILALILAFAPAGLRAGSRAQNTQTQNDDNDKGVKKDAKDVGHDTKVGAKKTGHAIKKVTLKVVHKSAQKTGQGADKVEDKTQPKQ